MMRFGSIVLLILLLSSCASSPEKARTVKSATDNEFANIENADFVPAREIPYRSRKDLFSGSESKLDSLAKESIARLPMPKLKVVSEKDNPITKGVSLCYQKRFNEGFAILDMAYEKYKSHPSYWNQLGTCYLLKGENRKALLFYNKSREKGRRYAPPINNLGVIYQKKGQYQKALMAFEKAYKMNPFSLTPVFNLAQIYLKYGFFNKALKFFNTLSKQNKADVDVLNGLATCHLFQGNYNKAISYYRRIGGDYLARADISINYSLALFFGGKKNAARKLFGRVEIDKQPGMKGYYQQAMNVIRK